jgi:hypothetical protein
MKLARTNGNLELTVKWLTSASFRRITIMLIYVDTSILYRAIFSIACIGSEKARGLA